MVNAKFRFLAGVPEGIEKKMAPRVGSENLEVLYPDTLIIYSDEDDDPEVFRVWAQDQLASYWEPWVDFSSTVD